MNLDEFQAFMDTHYSAIKKISSEKGYDYSGQQDALRSFKDRAERIDTSPEKVIITQADKHWNAILTWIREGALRSEPIIGRFHDILLYSFLMLALIQDSESAYDPELLQEVVEAGQNDIEFCNEYGTSEEVKLDFTKPKTEPYKYEYPHKYPGAPGHNPDNLGDCFTSDCEYGCGCWAGPSRSGGPDGVNPFGNCPKHPTVLALASSLNESSLVKMYDSKELSSLPGDEPSLS